MKSGLFGSRPSAMKATVTPEPSPSCCAYGLPSLVKARIDSSASGSTNGCAGSLGQIWVLDGVPKAGVVAVARDFALLLLAAPAAGGTTIGTCRSGLTDATAGSAARAAAWAPVTVAENALPRAKCLTWVGAGPASRL